MCVGVSECECVCVQIKEKGPMKGQFVEVVKRKIPLENIASVSLR